MHMLQRLGARSDSHMSARDTRVVHSHIVYNEETYCWRVWERRLGRHRPTEESLDINTMCFKYMPDTSLVPAFLILETKQPGRDAPKYFGLHKSVLDGCCSDQELSVYAFN